MAMIPLWIKVSYTLFVTGLAPVYWPHFGLAASVSGNVRSRAWMRG